MTSPAAWLARAQSLGSAYVAVLRAEVTAALQDLAASGRSVLRAALFATVTIALGFWTVGLLVYFLIEMLTLWLPRWGAVGAVFGLFLLSTLILAAVTVSRARRVEAPTTLLERRVRDHAAWWQGRIAAESEGSATAAEGEEEEA